ncbi:MAG TPA: hypothetical protein VMF13_17285, partial [Luteitalea sp.]|nr:hypothetical protein [Luteitalea sp.]
LHGFPSLVVLGGDKDVGTPRCVNHAWELRAAIRQRQPSLVLGGWANPHRQPERQVEFLQSDDFTGEYYLTQVATHHQVGDVERFLAEADRRGVTLPGVFGVFYYRSARRRTLDMLAGFMPVPVEELVDEFGAGASPETVCARTVRTLRAAGVRHFYISNLPLTDTDAVLHRILDEAGA